jgi:hypothetical protein
MNNEENAVLDYNAAKTFGLPVANLADAIDQNGVRPGKRKLEQFIEALELRGTPKLYTQDDKGDDAIAYVKLFDPAGSYKWYITEFSRQAPDGHPNLAFGYVTGTPDPEWAYIDLEEISEVKGSLGIGIEIDVWFIPKQMGLITGLRETYPADNEAEGEIQSIEGMQN